MSDPTPPNQPPEEPGPVPEPPEPGTEAERVPGGEPWHELQVTIPEPPAEP